MKPTDFAMTISLDQNPDIKALELFHSVLRMNQITMRAIGNKGYKYFTFGVIVPVGDAKTKNCNAWQFHNVTSLDADTIIAAQIWLDEVKKDLLK